MLYLFTFYHNLGVANVAKTHPLPVTQNTFNPLIYLALLASPPVSIRRFAFATSRPPTTKKHPFPGCHHYNLNPL
jgi:hypothetical protein